jgi:macrodomain Ter protein organizer (MatP/YcbG family)
METQYKVGDIVYRHNGKECLKGKVTEITNHENYPVEVEFEFEFCNEYFTLDGKYRVEDTIRSLSFTPYEVIFQGATFERPLHEIEVDTMVWVRRVYEATWNVRFFSHFKNGKCYCFAEQQRSTETDETTSWEYWSLECPL